MSRKYYLQTLNLYAIPRLKMFPFVYFEGVESNDFVHHKRDPQHRFPKKEEKFPQACRSLAVSK